MALDDRAEIDVYEDIAVDDDEGAAVEKRPRFEQPTAGIEQLGFLGIGNMQTELAAVAEMVAQHRAEVVHVHDNIRDAVMAQQEERVFDHGPARDADERLRQPVRQRPQARPEAGGEKHRLHRNSSK
jgi:hypothetical protein